MSKSDHLYCGVHGDRITQFGEPLASGCFTQPLNIDTKTHNIQQLFNNKPRQAQPWVIDKRGCHSLSICITYICAIYKKKT